MLLLQIPQYAMVCYFLKALKSNQKVLATIELALYC